MSTSRKEAQDATVSHPPYASDSVAMSRRNSRVQPVYRENEDELLARVLVTSWTLVTGRTLRAGVPPRSHSEEELISFWADDEIVTVGLALSSGAAGLP
jgi:hypothetical protein